jgi:hypothetical protein
MAKTGAPI